MTTPTPSDAPGSKGPGVVACPRCQQPARAGAVWCSCGERLPVTSQAPPARENILTETRASVGVRLCPNCSDTLAAAWCRECGWNLPGLLHDVDAAAISEAYGLKPPTGQLSWVDPLDIGAAISEHRRAQAGEIPLLPPLDHQAIVDAYEAGEVVDGDELAQALGALGLPPISEELPTQYRANVDVETDAVAHHRAAAAAHAQSVAHARARTAAVTSLRRRGYSYKALAELLGCDIRKVDRYIDPAQKSSGPAAKSPTAPSSSPSS